MEKQGYFIEFTGEYYQSVFPKNEADKGALHTTLEDAVDYMVLDCNINKENIIVIP